MDTSFWTVLLAFTVCVVSGHRHPEDELPEMIRENSCDQHFHGCTVQENRCHCETVTGCQNPWPYRNLDECHEDRQGSLDVCKHYPSCGRGFCVQSRHGGVREAVCECAGSGYYGKHCQNKCPDASGRLQADFPDACLLS